MDKLVKLYDLKVGEKFYNPDNNLIYVLWGKLFNWKKESLYYGREVPYAYIIDMGDIGEMYSAVYEEKEHNLCVYRVSDHMDFIANFYCQDIYFAELLIWSFLQANKKIDIRGTIYYKLK